MLNIHMCLLIESKTTTSAWALVLYLQLDLMLLLSITGLQSATCYSVFAVNSRGLSLIVFMHLSHFTGLMLCFVHQEGHSAHKGHLGCKDHPVCKGHLACKGHPFSTGHLACKGHPACTGHPSCKGHPVCKKSCYNSQKWTFMETRPHL